MGVTIFFFLATISLATNAQAARPSVPFQSHLLQPHSIKLRDLSINAICASWRLSVEVNNIRSWSLVPAECLEYITDYILGGQYIADCFTVADVAYAYAKSLTPSEDGKDIWVFDMDETALSEIDYYSQPDVAFGTKAFNETKKNEYLMVARSPPLIPVYLLYVGLLDQGFKIVFISGTSETYRDYRIANLKYAGYTEWEKVLLKSTSEHGITSLVYKSKKRDELVEEGYRIVGNVGDQWSDLLGSNTGNRTFKIPNPMYYIN